MFPDSLLWLNTWMLMARTDGSDVAEGVSALQANMAQVSVGELGIATSSQPIGKLRQGCMRGLCFVLYNRSTLLL